MTPNFKFDPKPKFFFFKLYLDLTDNFELEFVKIGRIELKKPEKSHKRALKP